MYGYDNFMGGISPTQKSMKDYICLSTNCSSVEMVDEFDTLRTRHICPNQKYINLLDKSYVPVPTSKGMVNVEIFFCPICRKLIINKSSMEIIG